MTTPEATQPKSRWGYLPQILCVCLPPCYFLALRGSNVFIREPWRDSFAACVIVAWQAAIVYWMVRRRDIRLARPLEEAFTAAMVQQAAIIVFAGLFTDCGVLLARATLAGMAFWMIAGLILSRRPATPTRTDVRLLYVGPLLLALAVAAAGKWLDASGLATKLAGSPLWQAWN